MKNNNEKIGNNVESIIKSIKEMIKVDTVIGEKLDVDGEIIIPISKVTYGYLTGGGEYGKISIFKKGNDLPYSVGNGAIVSIKPYGFLLKNGGEFKLLSAEKNSLEKIVDSISASFEKILEKGTERK